MTNFRGFVASRLRDVQLRTSRTFRSRAVNYRYPKAERMSIPENCTSVMEFIDESFFDPMPDALTILRICIGLCFHVLQCNTHILTLLTHFRVLNLLRASPVRKSLVRTHGFFSVFKIFGISFMYNFSLSVSLVRHLLFFFVWWNNLFVAGVKRRVNLRSKFIQRNLGSGTSTPWSVAQNIQSTICCFCFWMNSSEHEQALVINVLPLSYACTPKMKNPKHFLYFVGSKFRSSIEVPNWFPYLTYDCPLNVIDAFDANTIP